MNSSFEFAGSDSVNDVDLILTGQDCLTNKLHDPLFCYASCQPMEVDRLFGVARLGRYRNGGFFGTFRLTEAGFNILGVNPVLHDVNGHLLLVRQQQFLRVLAS